MQANSSGMKGPGKLRVCELGWLYTVPGGRRGVDPASRLLMWLTAEVNDHCSRDNNDKSQAGTSKVGAGK